MKFDPKPMVGWYNVKQLAATGLKTLVSAVFGNYSDKREIQAFARQEEFFDFSEREEIWIDYISDLGDGFNSTYTLAHLMAKDSIRLGEKDLPRGDILVMGGDEVYPTPEKIEYKNRLQGPYNAAFPWKNDEIKTLKPKLFAIPGNHDWYDGLTNFMRLFCTGRALGNWLTLQKRSYFALKLPHNYWLLGIDIQLQGDIDEPQMAYFKHVAASAFQNDDKIILCTAEPTWVFASLSNNFDANERLNFFIHRILKNPLNEPEKNKKVHIISILTGDLHHYSRYEMTGNQGTYKTQLITSGGGGAFLHPTHVLKEKIKFDDGFQAELKKTFPSGKQSKKLAWRNLAFPYYNWGMCLFLGAFHIITAWFVQSSAEYPSSNSLMETMATVNFSFNNLAIYMGTIYQGIKHSPSVVILNLILFIGIFLFTDTSTGQKKWNYIAGFFHATAQLFSLYFCIWIFSRWNLNLLFLSVDNLYQSLLFALEMLLIGGMAGGFIFGLYLLVSTLIFKSHPTESFSSIRHTGYKNFLRIHVSKEKLTIYPIGVKDVVENWRNVGTPEKPEFKGRDVSYIQIENEPVVIPCTL